MGPQWLTSLDAALEGVDRLGIDSAVVIYLIEQNPAYRDIVNEMFGRIDSGAVAGITSAITHTKMVIHPLRHGNLHLRDRYEELLLKAAEKQKSARFDKLAEATAASARHAQEAQTWHFSRMPRSP